MAKPKSPEAEDYRTARHAKDLLDMIGETVKKKAHEQALERSGSRLKGFLEQAQFKEGKEIVTGKATLCQLNHQYHTNVTSGEDKQNPCRRGEEERFSEVHGGECDYRKIRGSNDKDGGVCAPFRRLHLCDQHLYHMEDIKINTKHNLLLEVCLAAQYEGNSLKNYHDIYKEKYNDTRSQLCTELARSFADIGDIIRGKDLYVRNNKGKGRLENNIQRIFQKIYEELRKHETHGKEAEEQYADDAPQYYKLREDWWSLNRLHIWKAITCSAGGNTYFRGTCSDDTTVAKKHCQCIDGTVPTNLDYVPQYLRWFEEWAEDFCRKRKKQLENAIDKCRNDDEERYCSGNGYDCTQTVRALEIYNMEKNCHKCFFACSPFVKWLDNQKLEFLKQKENYNKEIEEQKDTEGASKGKINKMYRKEFYEKLKKEYKDVDKFLELLGKDKACQAEPEVRNKKANSVDFRKDVTNETFSRTDYCKPCPVCGGKFEGGKFISAGDNETACLLEDIYKPPEIDPNKIKVLISGEGHEDINKKLDEFCKNQGGEHLYEEWKCYHEADNDDKCLLEYKEEGKEKRKVKTFYNFFTFWVTHMLDDSMEWREKIKECLKNESKIKCKNICKSPCECFAKWVEQKKKEWRNITKHYDEQNGFGEQTEGAELSHYMVLEYILEENFLKGISNAYADPEHMDKIKKTLEKKKEERGSSISKEKTLIDFLLDHEMQDAKKCTETHNKEKCEEEQKKRQEERGTGARAIYPSPTRKEDSEDDNEEFDEEDDEEEEGEPEKVESESSKPDQKDTEGSPKEGETPQVENVCSIVDGVLTKTDQLQEACKQKYNLPQRYFGWKCVASSGTTTAQSGGEAGGGGEARDRELLHRRRRGADSESGAPTDSSKGGLCVPPRRRKMYIQPITKWVDEVASQTESGTDGAPSPQAEGDHAGTESSLGAPQALDSSRAQKDPLLASFVESAAIETYFLWDRYKKENKKTQNDGGSPHLQRLNDSIPTETEENQDPQQQLEKDGTIPEEFLRQMFYTLGDYRDIFFGVNDPDVKTALQKSVVKIKRSGSDEEASTKEPPTDTDTLQTISDKIEKILQQPGSSPTLPKSQPTDRKSLWGDFAPKIWNGMICALTYKTDTDKPQLDTSVQTVLMKDGKPKNSEYQYNTAAIDANNTTAINPGIGTVDAASGTKLTDFVEYPTFFRWLHEWGNEFCEKRTKMLEKIKYECKEEGVGRSGGTRQKYSEQGEECDEILKKDPTEFSDLSSTCSKPCIFYRGWIGRKKDEFEKQKGIYNKEKEQCQNGRGENSNGCCGIPGNKCDAVADFLHNLGSCTKDTGNGDGKDKLNFNEPEQTFRPATNCKPCSQFKIDCQGGKCKIGDTEKECKEDKITAATFDSGTKLMENGDTVEIDKLHSELDGDLKDLCNGNGDSEVHKKDKWKCRKFCGHIVCKCDNTNGENNNQQIVTITALLQRWVYKFLEDYKRIKTKLNSCEKNGKEYSCIKNCVQQWIDTKRTEWGKLRDRFLQQYENNDHSYPVRTFLENFLVQIGVANTGDKHIKLSKLDKSCVCSAKANEGKKIGNDAIDCMLHNLEEKVKKCEAPSSGENQKQCENSSPLTDNILEDEDDYPLEAPEENGKTNKQHPSFCKIEDPPAAQDEDVCDKPTEAPPNMVEEEESVREEPAPDDAGTEDGNGEPGQVEEPVSEDQGDNKGSETEIKSKDQEETSPKVPAPKTPKPKLPRPPQKQSQKVEPRPFTLADMSPSFVPLTVGMGFLALSYWLLKKKTKPPVDLLRVMEIPQNDYGMPTKHSPNRYVPYRSGKYRGKRYIYIEGDSGTDSGYTDHYSDITSSSESEYEEIDTHISRIPKYKTLIEVVLEPSTSGRNNPNSGKNTPNSDNTIPSSDNSIPNSGNTIPNSDDTPTPITDEEWNTIKSEFISNLLPSTQNDMPNNLPHNSDNNIHPNTLYDNMDEKPFIMSIHDRNLYTGEEYNYDMINSGENDSFSGTNGPYSGNIGSYSGIDLINDALSRQPIDIYDEILKRKENELFGTEHHPKKNITNRFSKPARDDPLHNQIDLFHKWLDRHRYMCEKWENNHERLDKLKEEWNNETHNGNIPSSNKTLSSDVSIQIHMDNPKTINEFSNMDTNLDNSSMDSIINDLEKYNEPYYDIYQHDKQSVDDNIYLDTYPYKHTMDSNPNSNTVDDIYMDSNTNHNPTHVQIEMSVKNGQIMEENYPISDIWNI
ncbi:erythrocyte membrane protein 1, PfEMP1 [Plasmodium sp. DRC-Itaito]|nr:erythrocyte membrane protein 1, PfEMP1 [Plasmodium sp. DRC-Itaito]